MSELLSAQIKNGLQEKVYEKRKHAALELERLVREWCEIGEYDQIRQVIKFLAYEYAYSNTPNKCSGGVLGLAGVAVGLGIFVNQFLDELAVPVIACLGNQDPQVRYYACEAMYNIASIAKSGILRFFNDLFGALSQLAADVDIQVSKGASHLNGLVKDIVTEYTSMDMPKMNEQHDTSGKAPLLFKLAQFIQLLSKCIYTSNGNTRMFLVDWLLVLNSVPNLELVVYLPEFLDGLLRFLNDSSQELRNKTDCLLKAFLHDINSIGSLSKSTIKEDESDTWIQGQGIDIDYARIIQILEPHIISENEQIQLTAIKWVNEFIQVVPHVVIPATPNLIKAMLPCLSSQNGDIRSAAMTANKNLFKLIEGMQLTKSIVTTLDASDASTSGRSSSIGTYARLDEVETVVDEGQGSETGKQETGTSLEREEDPFDYQAVVNALTLQFIDEHEITRVESLEWLLMLQRKAPHKVLATNDGMFPVLLKTLSDSSERVIKRDLQLLAQFSMYSDDTYFHEFMVHLLRLFSSDRNMLENRGSLIIRQLCVSLNPERIYRAFAEILEKEEDLEFAGIMVQNLNIILITAPELAELRKRLRRMEAKENQALFVTLYRSWCHNAVSTFSLCLLAQAYEHAANLLQIFAELEISVSFLIQLDKLVQLLESPVFTYLRLQLLEPDRYPYLFKCLYGILMLLPQSSAFATLRNRLNSVGPLNISAMTNRGTDILKRPKATGESTLRFNELLHHFRTVQLRHEETLYQNFYSSSTLRSSTAPTRRSRAPSGTASTLRSATSAAAEHDRARHGGSSTTASSTGVVGSRTAAATTTATTTSSSGGRPSRRIGTSTRR